MKRMKRMEGEGKRERERDSRDGGIGNARD